MNSKMIGASAALLFVSMAEAQGQQEISVVLNGEPVVFSNAQPREIQGRVMVPLRGILEDLGSYVDWDPASRTVSATKHGLDLRMSLGSRVAMVNGSAVPLEVPAQVVNGTTMVPLRFVSEALGANVDWLASTQTVEITTSVAEAAQSQSPATQTYTATEQPAQPASPAISSFTSNRSGFLPPGSRVRFTLEGSPGGQATFQIPGVTDDISMREEQPGRYVGEWRVPVAAPDGLVLSDTSAVAKLVLGSNSKMVEMSNPISIDAQPPTITAMRPPSDEVAGSPRPTISARMSDGAGSGIERESIRLTLDGKDVTDQATVTRSRVAFRPQTPLAAGMHDADLTVRDMAGNESNERWTFKVARRAKAERHFTFTKLPTYGPGAVIDFSLDAEPGATATFSIGDRRTELPMREVSPGHYEGSYTIRKGDSFKQQPIRARIRTSDGGDYWVDADRELSTPAMDLRQPSVSWPHENSTVDSPLIVKGTATPYSEVMIHVTASSLMWLNTVRVHSTVGDYTVQADEHGYFQSPPIDLDKAHGANKRFAVTVYSLDSNGKKSAVTTINTFQ